MNIPELMAYAKSKNVRLLIWAHSLDIETFGVDAALKYLAEQGFAGVKIDFLNSQSQETVQWCEKVLATAAKYHLLIDFHGTYKPTGLARTYPNFITQEGVLGNENNKWGEGVITPQHTINLAFTRALLGPMDFTPGGFHQSRAQGFQDHLAHPGHGHARTAACDDGDLSQPADGVLRQSKKLSRSARD